MRVKIGETWYDDRDTPIMVEVTERDRWNIKHMPLDNQRYASFPDGEGWDNIDTRSDWMKK
jgi:hypothetical protein